jgi:hypothetical protein
MTKFLKIIKFLKMIFFGDYIISSVLRDIIQEVYKVIYNYLNNEIN